MSAPSGGSRYGHPSSGVWLNPDGSKEYNNNTVDYNGYAGILEKARTNPAEVVIGTNARTVEGNSIVVIENASAVLLGNDRNNVVGSVVIGSKSFFYANPYGIFSQEHGGGQGVTVGSGAVATSQASAFGNDVYAIGRSSIVLGSDDNAQYPNRISEYDLSNYFQGLYKKIDPNGSSYGFNQSGSGQAIDSERTQWSPTLANGHGSIAIGSRSLAYADGSTALGTLAFALKKGSTAVGTQTRAEGVGSIALDSNTSIFANNSVGAGNEIQILQKDGMAYGYQGYSAGQNAMAIGSGVFANATVNIDQRMSQSPLGAVDIAEFERVVESAGFITPTYQVKNGVSNVVTQLPGKNNAIVLGSKSAAMGNNAIAIGRGTVSESDNTFAIGSYSYAKNENALALGMGSRALARNSMAFGVGSGVAEGASDSLSIGTKSLTTGIRSTLVGSNSLVSGTDSLLFGGNGQLAGTSNVGVGNSVKVLDSSAKNLAFGNSVTIGRGVNESVLIGTESAIGSGAQASLTNSVALGTNSRIDYTQEELQADPWVMPGAIALPTSTKIGVVSVGAKN